MVKSVVILILFLTKNISADNTNDNEIIKKENLVNDEEIVNAFDGVYSECLLKFSYICLQKKTLLYLKALNRLSEVSIIGDYLKLVKINSSEIKDTENYDTNNSEELSHIIDKAVDNFFDSHLIRISGFGKDVALSNTDNTFVGRKKRKGGGGHGGDDDGGKKKMFMMAMMCMKMKMMMMVPAMMGMMGMMSFKGMMFSMMSFMISKMMLLMKLLEKKGGGSGSWNSGGDAGWANTGGAWMPAAAADYGGGYDANGQWQSRSIIERLRDDKLKPKIALQTLPYKTTNTFIYKNDLTNDKPKIRRRRGLLDTLQNAYLYWMSKILGAQKPMPKHKIINGVKYIYQPVRPLKRGPKAVSQFPVVVSEDFNKGEIVEVPEGRMIKRKFHKMKENVKEAVEDNPWE